MPAAAPAVQPATQRRRVLFTGKQQAICAEEPIAAPGPREALVRTRLSLMSTGTENIIFNQLYEPGSHWDRWVKFPFAPGYASVGVVEAIGAEVTEVAVGDRVAHRCPHASRNLVTARDLAPIPAGVTWEQASWHALAKICFMGARAAEYKLGDSVLIIGAGPIGQMSVRWAAAAGCRTIVVVDTVEGRLAMARAGGATAVVAEPIERAADLVRAACGGSLPRVVIDGTGHDQVFAHALQLAADRGRVVILGDTGTPTRQHLTGDVITRGLTIAGAHDSHNDATWNRTTIPALFFDLVERGRFNLDGLITHTFPGSDAAAAYAAANRERGRTMGILFDWSDAGGPGAEPAQNSKQPGRPANRTPGSGEAGL